jgi:hypothetical protein
MPRTTIPENAGHFRVSVAKAGVHQGVRTLCGYS